jgi:type IV fimbrial biogenesis protein FimT
MQLREAVLGGANPDQFLPASSCFAADWSTDTSSRQVTSFDDRRARYEWAQPVLRDNAGAEVPYLELCFTPRGRTFARQAANGTFVPLNTVYRFEVTNTETGLVRQVIIPPNGAARLESRL